MPKPDLSKARAAAGARYAKACDELRESLIDLAAIDGLAADGDGRFAASCPDVLGDLRHREFQPHPPQGMRAAVEARRATLGQSGRPLGQDGAYSSSPTLPAF